MLFLIIAGISIIIGGIVFLIRYYKCIVRDVFPLEFLFFAFGIFILIICLPITISAHIHPDFKYQQDYIEYEVLQEQIDSGTYNSITITSEIISYNQKVMGYKKYADSKWIGIFFYEGCENLPLLEIKE